MIKKSIKKFRHSIWYIPYFILVGSLFIWTFFRALAIYSWIAYSVRTNQSIFSTFSAELYRHSDYYWKLGFQDTFIDNVAFLFIGILMVWLFSIIALIDVDEK